MLWKIIKNARYLKGMTKKSTATILSVENPYGDYHTLTLKPGDNVTWQAGEHAVFTLPDHKETAKGFRTLSISSIQSEGVILLGTRTGKEISDFKKTLLALKPGETVVMRGPFGWFRIRDDQSPIILFASGVGITPVRAVLKELEHDQARPIHVVYASEDYYLFGDEIQAIAANNPSISLHKTRTTDETQAKLASLAKQYGNKAYYYMSASPRVIASVSKLLLQSGIAKNRLIDDTMNGY